MSWQKARMIPPTDVTEEFWVQAVPPEKHSFPALNETRDGFDTERVEGEWYRTNVLEPDGHFCMWAPQNGVELLAEFADHVDIDHRYLKGANQ